MRISPSCLVLVVLMAPPTVAHGANLLINGSFEQGPDLGGFHDVTLNAGSTAIPGWTIFGHSIDFTGPPWDVSDGAHAVDLDGRDAVLSGVAQTFATVAGRTYIVSFDLSGNPEGPPQLKRVRVTIDGFSQDYEHDSSGQSETSLLWQSITFSFIASGSSATLSFMSLQETANSFGPLIDRVRVEELEEGATCAYSFASGEGAARIHYCVSANGTIVELEGPAGQEHISVGIPWEGFVICTGTTVQAWDLTATADGFGSSSQHGRQASTGVTLRRTSADYELEEVFKLDKDEKEITIEMTLTNISGSAIPDVRITRAYDPDPNNDAGDDLETTSTRSVIATDADALTLTGITWGLPTDTAVDTGPSPACSPAGGTVPRITTDSSLATVTYHIGSLEAKARKQVVFAYRVQ